MKKIHLLAGFLIFSPRKARDILFVIVFCLGMALPILPWTVRNALVFHRFIPVSVGSGFNLWYWLCCSWLARGERGKNKRLGVFRR